MDTGPYNAHTITGDALWVDLPVLGVKGKSFASRVASSLIYVAGILELVVETEEDCVDFWQWVEHQTPIN
ncbi:hypothetical protein [Polynucleobacter necessarius]|uniref:O-linked N-acetylglucosamine transferase family protein n=1 Tax=Polynucleobacter necessarius TaxID=576610 RepID=UPI0013B06693|nr:hypothetical protein [Polynucleobacter necessarius]